MSDTQKLEPILKWVGGKRQLLDDIKENMPDTFNRYYEPFFGGGALLFDLAPEHAVINDVNTELINLYTVIRDNVDELINDLSRHENTAEYFYDIRKLDRTEDFANMSPISLASRMIYLNKTCYNGLYRVNAKNQFNTPFGKYKNPKILDEERLRAISNYFNDNDIQMYVGDFEEVLETAAPGDFVYLDPPYDPVSETAAFTSYSVGGFSREDQVRLYDKFVELDEKGINVMLSNSATDFIKELYSDFNVKIVKAKRNVNSKGNKRGEVEEVLVTNYGRKNRKN